MNIKMISAKRSPLGSLPTGLLCLIALAGTVGPAFASPSSTELLRLLATSTHFAIMRHAIAPGFSDPENMSLENCATQRNLDESGRQQATKIGKLLRANGIEQARVYTSEWCRCKDTAELLGFAVVEPLPVLNSFFEQRERSTEQTAQLAQWLSTKKLDQPTILVTHQVNITALTGQYTASGELIVLKKSAEGELEILGSVKTDDF